MNHYKIYNDKIEVGEGVNLCIFENSREQLTRIEYQAALGLCTLEHVQPKVILSKLEFLKRFTPQERIAIKTSADPIVQDLWELVSLAEYVATNDPVTIQGLGYLESVGLLAVGRKEVVLT